MIIYKCDYCGKTDQYPLQIQLNGYYPKNAGGVLIPEAHRKFQFCKHDCYVGWTRMNLKMEDHAPDHTP